MELKIFNEMMATLIFALSIRIDRNVLSSDSRPTLGPQPSLKREQCHLLSSCRHKLLNLMLNEISMTTTIERHQKILGFLHKLYILDLDNFEEEGKNSISLQCHSLWPRGK